MSADDVIRPEFGHPNYRSPHLRHRNQLCDRQPMFDATVLLDPLVAEPLLEPDGVVWQITTLEA